jgi:hypothetical protein
VQLTPAETAQDFGKDDQYGVLDLLGISDLPETDAITYACGLSSI